MTGHYANLTRAIKLIHGQGPLFVETSDLLPSHPTNEDARATDPFGGSSVTDDWLLLKPPQVKQLWFQHKQVEADSQSMTECSIGRMGIYTL